MDIRRKKADVIVATEDIKNSAPYFVFKANNKKIYIAEDVNIIDLNNFIEKAVSSL